MKPGRLPLRASPSRVNCEITSRPPPTSASARFILPAWSSKTRSPASLSAMARASASPSSRATPSSTTRPWPTAPPGRPSTRTSPRLPRCTPARMVGHDTPCPMLLLRDAQRSDLAGLAALAAELDSVNLPNDPRALGQIVDRSVRSFTGRIADPLDRSYVFVAEAPRSGRLVGTSMVIAKHGTRESPCTFFTVSEKEHYSSTLDRHFRHTILSLGYHFDGPTEIGGLVVRPGARRSAERAGKQLSFVRFLYLAMHRGPKQASMILDAAVVLVPTFHQPFPLMEPKERKHLNYFASIWMCIENILLSAVEEGIFGVTY